MLRPAASAKRPGISIAWGGGAAIVAAVLAFMQQQLDTFNLDQEAVWVVSGAIIVAGLAIAQLGKVPARRQATLDLEDALDEALACWPPRLKKWLSPFDVGVRPGLSAQATLPPYLKRHTDDDIADALESSDIVVVFGPAGAGKSRSAFAAVPDDAILLVPEDREGLATLLRRWQSLELTDNDAVLWLDGFERYAEGLDVDPIVAFLQPAPVRRRRWPWQKERRAASAKVVATIRDDALERLLGGEDPGSYPARRLMSAAQGVFVPGELNGTEQSAFTAQFGAPPAADSVPEAFGSAWRAGWRSGDRPSARPASSTPWKRRRVDMWLIVFPVALGLAGGWLFANRHELKVPLPIEQQVANLVDAAQCPLETFPARGEGIKDDVTTNAGVLVAIEHGGQCGVSDELRFYRRRDGRLREVASLAPDPAMTRQTFACRGPGANPCHVTLLGNQRYIVGAYEDAKTHQELPVVISFEGSGLEVWPLVIPKVQLDDVPKSIRASDSRPDELQLRVGAAADQVAAESCEATPYCSRGRRAQATAILPPTEDGQPPLLVTGYTTEGSPDSPDRLMVRVWSLKIEGGRPVVDRRCVVLRRGRAQPVEIKHTDGVLQADWKPDGAEVMCLV